MVSFSSLPQPFLLSLGARLVGATFVWTGVIKAIAPQTFYNHLSSLEWLPGKYLRTAVSVAAGLEFGWGFGLVLGLCPGITLPATVALIIALTAVSWWGVKTGRALDCGCYGGYVQPSITQSILLNGLFIALLLVSLRASPASFEVSIWKLSVAVAGTLSIGILAESAQRYRYTHVRPMFDTNPLKEGKRWRDGWAGGVTTGVSGEFLIAYIGPDCPHCRQFVRVANVMEQSNSLPKVFAVMASTEKRRRQYITDNAIRFPLGLISQSLMGRVAEEIPTTVLVHNGTIERMWMGNIPPDYVQRLRDAFFPAANEGGGLGLQFDSAERLAQQDADAFAES